MVPRVQGSGVRLGIGILILAMASTVPAADGDLDTTLDGNGIVYHDMGATHDRANGIERLPDGRTVLVGMRTETRQDIAVLMLHSHGGRDFSFGSDGRVFHDGGWGNDAAWDVAMQADGKLVVVGSIRLDSLDEFFIMRLSTNGSLDSSFGSGGAGFTTVNFGQNSVAHAVALQQDGKIVVVGSTDVGTSIAVARLNSNGSLDTSFDTDGMTTYNGYWGVDEGWDVVILHDSGKILVAGSSEVDAIQNFTVLRYNSNGSLDTTFGSTSNGYSKFHFGQDSFGHAIVVQPDGRIVVAGSTDLNTAMAVARLDEDGHLDTTFSTDGLATFDFVWGVDEGWDVMLQPDNKIIVAGSATIDQMHEFAMVRFTANGTVDTSFGGFGYVSTAIGANADGRAAVMHGDGTVSLAGFTRLGSHDSFAMTRYIAEEDLFFSDGFRFGVTDAWSSVAP